MKLCLLRPFIFFLPSFCPKTALGKLILIKTTLDELITHPSPEAHCIAPRLVKVETRSKPPIGKQILDDLRLLRF